MAKLPYTITICPDQPNPKQFTANHPSLVKALKYSNDLTIDQRAYIWPAAPVGKTRINPPKREDDDNGQA